MKRVLLIAAVLILSHVSICNALSPDTHEEINEHVARNALKGFSLDAYLKNNLEIKGGVDEIFKLDNESLKVWKWIRKGGRYEDKPPLTFPYHRSFNHFHNPLTEEGYNPGMSSTQWMFLPKGTQWPGGNYSWHDVRDYYLKALGSPDKDTRGKNFAETFRGLGQLMHLVQDASVPAHTRDDGYVAYNYETWVADPENVSIDAITPIFFGGTVLNAASLIDTDQYNGGNPEVATGNSIGISEYTNANFFSEETINVDNFPYPWISEYAPLVERSYTNEFWNATYPRQYHLKKCCGETNGGEGYLLSAVDFFDYYRRQFPLLGELLPIIPVLDDNVYEDYASFLLPRAVGYSSGLINHFFRAEMDMTIDPEDSSGYVIKNKSGEKMSGKFHLYYDDAEGNRHPVLDAPWELDIDPNDSEPVNFEKPTDPEPAEKGKYILVFHGELGNETGAVAGKVVTLKDEGMWEEWNEGTYTQLS